MTLIEHLQQAVSAWVASKGDPEKEAAVQAILNTPEYRAECYLTRNRQFITSTKLLKLEYDPFLCKIEMIDEVPPPVPQDSEALVTGSAVDEWATYGEEQFRSRYVAVPRRDKKAEESNPGKVLLTNGQMETVTNAVREFQSRHFFPKQLQKKNILALAFGLPLKAELDGFDEERKVIQDLKTTANLNSFLDDLRPGKRFYEKYIFQLAFYSFCYEMRYGERVTVCELLVCDKYDWCRSHLIVVSYQTVMAQFPRIERLLQDWSTYQETSIWPFLLRLDTLDGLQKFNDSPFYSHPLLATFKESIQPTYL